MWETHAKKSDRLDRLLRSLRHTGAEWLSRQAWERLLADGFVRVDGRIQTKGGAAVPQGAKVEVRFPGSELGLLPAEFSARLVWLDPAKHWGIFFKDPGLATYPLMPWDRSAFANQVSRFLAEGGPISAHAFAALAEPPRLEGGVLQRLDRDTSGLVCVAFDSGAKSLFRKLFSGGIEKGYLALVRGDAIGIEGEHQLSFHAPKGGKTRVGEGETAELRIRVMEANSRASLVEVTTAKGIRHIVRAALAHLGHPIVGDKIYGSAEGALFHQLHAHRLRLLDGAFPFPSGVEALPPQSFLDCRLALGLH